MSSTHMDRFKLEELIVACWQVADDMDLAAESLLEDAADIDDVCNVLTGMASVHRMRCQKLMDMFETMLENGDIQ